MIFVRKAWWSLSLLAALAAAPAAWGSSTPLRISGRVVDRDLGAPLDSVEIRIEETGARIITDDDGVFVLEGLDLEHVTLVVKGERLETLRVRVAIAEHAEPVVLRVALDVPAVYGVVVRAPRQTPRTASTTEISQREIASVPKRNAEDALRLVPGLTLIQHGSEGKGHQFFLRGFDATHGADLSIDVDGIPVNEWSNVHGQGYVDLGFVIPETIRGVTVTKGPYTAEQGAFAMAGSASYRLGIPREDAGLRIGYTAGSTNRHRLLFTWAPPEGDRDTFAAAEAMTDSGFGHSRQARRASAMSRVNLLDSVSAGRLSLFGSAYASRFELPGTIRHEDALSGRVGFYDAYDDNARGLSERAIGAIAYDRKSSSHGIRANAFTGYRRLALWENFTGYLRDPVAGDRFEQHHRALSFGARATYEGDANEKLSLLGEVGVRGDLFEQSEDHVGSADSSLEMVRAVSGLQTIAHGWAGLRLLPVAALRLDAGARVDLVHVRAEDGLDQGASDSGTLVALSPRLTLRWNFRPAITVFSAYGRGFRPPEARAFSGQAPERTGLGEERPELREGAITVSDSLEAGGHFEVSRYMNLRIAAFGSLIERESIFDHVSGTSIELNGTQRIGAEVLMMSRPTDWLSLSGDLSFVDARFRESGNPVPLAPWLVGGLRGVLTHAEGYQGGLRFIGIAPRKLPHGARSGPLTAVDLTLGYHRPTFRVDLEIENLLNRRVQEGEYHFPSHWRLGEEPSEIPALHFVAGPPLNARLTLTMHL